MSIDDDKRCIRELVENWAVWRDARLWDRFRTVWHADGRMMATWFQGSFEEFIAANEQGWARGVRILHFLGGSAIDIGDWCCAGSLMKETASIPSIPRPSSRSIRTCSSASRKAIGTSLICRPRSATR